MAVEQCPNKSVSINYLYKTLINKDYGYKNKDIFFIFGNEITGISSEIISTVDFVCELPMLGIKNSLNVSNTAAIVLYYFVLRNSK